MTRRFIASDVGGHKELVDDGVTGRLFQAGDPAALATAALDTLDPAAEARNAAMIAPALDFVRTTRSWSAVAQRYVPVYERLTGQTIEPMRDVGT